MSNWTGSLTPKQRCISQCSRPCLLLSPQHPSATACLCLLHRQVQNGCPRSSSRALRKHQRTMRRTLRPLYQQVGPSLAYHRDSHAGSGVMSPLALALALPSTTTFCYHHNSSVICLAKEERRYGGVTQCGSAGRSRVGQSACHNHDDSTSRTVRPQAGERYRNWLHLFVRQSSARFPDLLMGVLRKMCEFSGSCHQVACAAAVH